VITETSTLARLLDPARVHDLLPPATGQEAARRLADDLVRCARRLHRDGVAADRPVCAFRVPGRIEVLGKHTDYGGGRSLLAALDRGICLVAAARDDATVTFADAGRDESAAFPLDAELRPESGWRAYPMTVARRVARNFPGPLRGADVALASNLPAAAGMSSSSALVVGAFLVLSAVNELPRTAVYRAKIGGPEALADYVAAIESGADYRGLPGGQGVGTRGGSQDHTAILCARPGELVQYAFGPVRFERSVPLPAGYLFAVAVSGVRAEKTGDARQRYNRAAEQMRRAVEVWRSHTGRDDASLGAALAADPAAAERLPDILLDAGADLTDGEALVARVRQFLEESTRIVPAAGDALARGDLLAFGRHVDRSQHLAEVALGNQVPETVALARSARELGAAAASAFGAGFGGSVWALVGDADSAAFLDRWRDAYRARFPRYATTASFFTTHASPPAVRLA
jgi:galactokinase